MSDPFRDELSPEPEGHPIGNFGDGLFLDIDFAQVYFYQQGGGQRWFIV